MGLISNIPVNWARVLSVASSPEGEGVAEHRTKNQAETDVCEPKGEVRRVIPGPFAEVWKSHPDPGLE